MAKRQKKKQNRKIRLQPQIASRRTIGHILSSGPSNTEETLRLERYFLQLEEFYALHFSGLDYTKRAIQTLIDRSLISLRLIHGDFRHAIQTKNKRCSQELLRRVAQNVLTMVDQHQEKLVGDTPPDRVHEALKTLKLIGYGEHPADSCQECGNYLTKSCYSEIYNSSRVPRTNKICGTCFNKLSKNEQSTMHYYEYGRRPEARGTGWQPKGGWRT